MRKLLSSTYYILFFTIPLLMFPKTSELFEFNKMLFIYFSAATVFLLWIIESLKSHKFEFGRTPLDIFIAVFLGSQILSTLFSIDIHTSFFGYYGRFNGGLLSIIAYIVLYYGFATFFPRKEIDKLLKTSLFASFFVILWGLPGRFDRDLTCFVFSGELGNSCWTDQFRPAERMFSTLGQPNWLGAYLAVNFFIGLYFYASRLRSKHKSGCFRQARTIIMLCYLFFNFSAVLFTRSRSALLAIIIGSLYCLSLAALAKWDSLIVKKKVFKSFIPIGIVMLLSILIFKTGIIQLDRVISFSALPVKQIPTSEVGLDHSSGLSFEITESLDIRKIVWRGAFELGLRYPLFGTGVETFAYAYDLVRPKEHNLTSEWDFIYNKAHNEYLNYLATTGFIGLGTYLLFIGSVMWFVYIKIKEQRAKSKTTNQNSKVENKIIFTICLSAAWLTILVTNFFGFSITVINLYLFLIPAVVLVYSGDVEERKYKINLSNMIKLPLQYSALFIYVLFLFWLGFYFAADMVYAKGKLYSQTEDHQTAAKFFQKARQMHYEHIYDDKLSQMLASISMIAVFEKNKEAQNIINESDILNKKAIIASPKNVVYWKTRSRNNLFFYQATSDDKYLKEAIRAADAAQKLAPTDPRIPYTKAVLLSSSQALAFDSLNRAIMLKPDFVDAYLLKIQLEKNFQLNDKAKETADYALKNLKLNTDQKKEIEDIVEK